MIHNTHYNLIDTLIFAFGIDRWNEICQMVIPAVKERIGEESILIPFQYDREYWKQFKDLSHSEAYDTNQEIRAIVEKNNPESEFLKFQTQIQHTIVECVLWARTEGNILGKNHYGMPKE